MLPTQAQLALENYLRQVAVSGGTAEAARREADIEEAIRSEARKVLVPVIAGVSVISLAAVTFFAFRR